MRYFYDPRVSVENASLQIKQVFVYKSFLGNVKLDRVLYDYDDKVLMETVLSYVDNCNLKLSTSIVCKVKFIVNFIFHKK